MNHIVVTVSIIVDVCLLGMISAIEKRVASSIMWRIMRSSTSNNTIRTTALNLVETRVDVVALSAGRCHMRHTLQELTTDGMRSRTFLSTPALRMIAVTSTRWHARI